MIIWLNVKIRTVSNLEIKCHFMIIKIIKMRVLKDSFNAIKIVALLTLAKMREGNITMIV